MKKNIAVVGCGHWGKNLVRNFAELKRLYAVCDPNDELAKMYSNKFNVKNLSFEEILSSSKISGVVLAVPASLHASMGLKVMKSKKDLFVEKPLALNAKEGKEMIHCAEFHGVNLMVGHLIQYHPAFIKLLDLVRSGKIGSLQYMYSNRLSFGKIRNEENVIWSFAPHDISMILAVANEVPNHVTKHDANILQDKISDSALINFQFKSGLRSHIFVSWLHPFKEHKFVVIGSSGMLVFDDRNNWNQKLAFYENSVDLKKGVPQIQKSDAYFFKLNEIEPLKAECMHFADVVDQKLIPKTSGLDGMKVLDVLSRISS